MYILNGTIENLTKILCHSTIYCKVPNYIVEI